MRVRLSMAAYAAIVTVAGGLAGPAAAQETRQDLEQALKAQQAENEALSERIAQIEAMLKTDVCADPQAAEALLEAVETTPAR